MLLVAMPNGFGLYHGTKADRRIVDRIPTGKTADDLVKASTTAIERMGAARGLKLVPHVSKTSSSSWKTIAIGVGGAIILALLAPITYLYVRGPGKQAR